MFRSLFISGDHVSLRFTHLDLNNWGARENCSLYSLKVRDGRDATSPLIGSYCSRQIPYTITSQGNALHLNLFVPSFSSMTLFRALYSVELSSCGGDLSSEEGRFASPGYPNNYPDMAECIWKIGGSPGNKVRVMLLWYDIVETDGCNGDYLEVHAESVEGNVLGLYCGTAGSVTDSLVSDASDTYIGGTGSESIRNVTFEQQLEAESLWIKFNSDQSGSRRGFLAYYYLVHGNEISGTAGTIASPMWPHAYRPLVTSQSNQASETTWRVTVSEGKVVRITYDNFNIQWPSYEAQDCSSYLVVHDGYDETAQELLHSCGTSLPDPLISTSNVVFIRLVAMRSSYSSHNPGSKFKLQWHEMATSEIQGGSANNEEGCRHYIFINSSATVITNPGYGRRYENNMDCEWVLSSEPGTRMQFFVSYISMETSRNCRLDYLEILDGMKGKPGPWNKSASLCNRIQSGKVYFSSGAAAKLRFVTDGSVTRYGFRLIVKAVCGGYVTATRQLQVITSPKVNATQMYPANTSCLWIVEARIGRPMRLTFSSFEILSGNSECLDDYLTLRNGGTPTSPLMLINPEQGTNQNGRLCGSTIPNAVNTSSNIFSVSFISNGDGNQGSGFQLGFRELSFGCGGHVYLQDSLDPNMEVYITSPNYPNTPPAHAECIWIIMAPAGKEVQFDVSQRFDLIPSRACQTEGLEVRDGGTEEAPGFVFCHDMPHTQKSSGNTMYVKYYTNSDTPNTGFYAKASTARCGGTIRVGQYGNTHIRSPNWPSPYGSSQFDCEWNVVGPIGHYLTFSFPEIRLPRTMNCSETDYIQIRDSPNLDPVNCGYYQAETCSQCRGGQSGCRGECRWDTRSSTCLMSDGAIDRRAEVLGTVCHWHSSHNNATIDSASNHAIVRFKTDARWTCASCKFTIQVNASIEGCQSYREASNGIIEGSSGVIQSPNYPSGLAHRVSCTWNVQAPDPKRIKVQMDDFDLPPPQSYLRNNHTRWYCPAGLSMYNGFDWITTSPLSNNWTICGSNPNLGPFYTTGNKLRLRLYSHRAGSDYRGFKLRWSTNENRVCGGTITSSSGIISSPRNTSNIPFYPASTSCHWQFRPYTGPNGQLWEKTIVFKANRIRIAKFIHETGEYCTSALTFRTGSSDSPKFLVSPRLICGQINEPTIIRSPYKTNDVLFGTKQAKYITPDIGFNITYNTFDCGGVLTGPTNTIQSVNYPRQYPENTDCAWLLEYPEGEQIVIPQNEVIMDLQPQSDNQCSPSSPDYIEVRNGGEPYAPLIWRGCGNSPPPTIRSMSNKLWIVFHSSNHRSGSQSVYRGFSFQVYSSSSLGEYGGCGGHLHGQGGNISSPVDTSHPSQPNYPNNIECVYYIDVGQGYHVNLKFVDRFNIERPGSTGRCNDYLFVEEKWGNSTSDQVGEHDYRQISPRLCGSENPPNITSTRDKIRITFRSNSNINAEGFKISWERRCGETFYGGSGVIRSPKYPIKYDSNLKCEYRLEASPNDYVTLEFLEPFEIEGGSDGRCPWDWVAVNQTWNNLVALDKHCGTQLPPFVNTRGSTLLAFKTDHSIQMKGFSARFNIHPCGGNITTETEISSPMNTDRYHHNTNCIWTITAPNNRVVGIKFNRLDLEGSSRCYYDHVSTFEGATTNRSQEIGRYCGNQTDQPPMMKSTGNVMTVQFKTDSSVTGTGFHAIIKFVYGPQQGCGGNIEVTGSTTRTISSYDADGDNKYENDMDCHWLIIGDPGKVLKLTFTRFELESRGTNPSGEPECFDYLEIYDGRGPSDPLIGKFCGSRALGSFTGVGNFMWIRFSSDEYTDWGQYSRLGFTARIENRDPVCGSHLIMNATSSSQVITKYKCSKIYIYIVYIYI